MGSGGCAGEEAGGSVFATMYDGWNIVATGASTTWGRGRKAAGESDPAAQSSMSGDEGNNIFNLGRSKVGERR